MAVDSVPILFGLFFGFVVLSFVAIVVGGIVKVAHDRRAHAALLKDGVRGTATVVDNRMTSHTDTDGRSQLSFQAVVVLDNQDDAQPVTLGDRAMTSFLVGSRMDVVYDPADPSRVKSIRPPSAAWYAVGAVMLVLLVGFVGFAGFVVLMTRSGVEGM